MNGEEKMNKLKGGSAANVKRQAKTAKSSKVFRLTFDVWHSRLAASTVCSFKKILPPGRNKSAAFTGFYNSM